MPGLSAHLTGHHAFSLHALNGARSPYACRPGRRASLLSVTLTASLLLAGCVGGPGSYFESVSREKNLAGQQPASSEDAPDMEVASVESADLAPLGSDGTNSAELVPDAEPDTALASGVLLPDSDASPATVPEATTQSGNPIPIGLVQTETGDVLLLPGTDGLTGTGEPANAYASQPSPVEQQPPALASLATENNGEEAGGSFVIGSETIPVIDPLEAAAEARIPFLDASISHGQCQGGFGPKPKKIGARRINPGDPYYIEIRMRQTPLLPVGHTYVAYGRLGADGEPLDERLIMLAPVGGYAGAALASGIPMPGILTPHRDDCRIRPDVGYRVSLNAQRYEKLLREVQQAKAEKPSYLLLAYNCNHFMTRIAGSVGILPPKNIYLPAVQYLYAMIERNEGISVSRF